ncbi:triacylglycerol lipase [Nesterenkonia sp. Act20]|uniref:esterase/lipase family protein n=1 Tax=Nesterenkonia sp. Act20 TaxID=1483432 RepID=UPI001C480CCC|nr:lysophospholipase [Nesterenkonia sp. Act20]
MTGGERRASRASAGTGRTAPRWLAEAGINLDAWVRDYAYALRSQASGGIRRPTPRRYRLSTPESPSILLLPGIYETWTFMLPVADVLRAEGYDVHAVLDLGRNGGTIEDMAELVDAYIRREGIAHCMLVAHSKGGLIGKLLLARHNEAGVIQGLVAINTPFAGSPLARLLPFPALRVFRPRSPELVELAASREVDRNIVSIYGRFDPHIPGGSHLDGAHNIQLETRGHFRPLADPRVHGAVLEGVRHLTG